MKVMKRFTAVGVSALMLMVLLAGCGGGNNNAAEVKGLKSQIATLQSQNKSLQDQLASMQVTEVTPQSSLQNVGGSSVPSFVTIGGKIKFPIALMLPNSADDVNNSNVMVGSRFKYTPSSNWDIQMNGTTMELSHPSKIWGSIKAVTVKDPVQEALMQPLLKSFFTGFPKTTISYRKAFMDDRVIGMIASAPIVVDKKNYVVNVGFVTRGESGQLYLFAYEDNKSGVQQELIDLMIGSAMFGDVKLKLE